MNGVIWQQCAGSVVYGLQLVPFGKHLADSTGRGNLSVGERGFGKPCSCGVFGTFAEGGESSVQGVGAVISGYGDGTPGIVLEMAPAGPGFGKRASKARGVQQGNEVGGFVARPSLEIVNCVLKDCDAGRHARASHDVSGCRLQDDRWPFAGLAGLAGQGSVVVDAVEEGWWGATAVAAELAVEGIELCPEAVVCCCRGVQFSLMTIGNDGCLKGGSD